MPRAAGSSQDGGSPVDDETFPPAFGAGRARAPRVGTGAGALEGGTRASPVLLPFQLLPVKPGGATAARGRTGRPRATVADGRMLPGVGRAAPHDPSAA